MAELKLGNIKPVGADNVVVESKYVKGGYVVVTSIAERDALKGNSGENIIKGSLCYCTADSTFYQYNGTAWVEKEFGAAASQLTAGLMSKDDKKKLDGIEDGAEVNVQPDWNVTDEASDAFIKNKPNVIVEGDTRLSDPRTPTSHSHGNISNDGALGTASRIVVTGTDKKITTGSIDPAKLVVTTDSRLSDPRTPTSHTHGSITNDGKLDTASRIVVTDDSKNVTVGTIDPANLVVTSDTRLTDARTPKAHTHTKSDITDFPISLPADGGNADTVDGMHANEFALKSHGTHVTAATVKSALGTGTGTSKYLREDGTWATPPDTNTQDGNDNQTVKTGSVTFGANDVVEFVAGSNVTIKGDATKKTLTINSTDTTYSVATTTADGLMSQTDKSNLDIIVNSFNNDDSNTTIDTIKEVLKAFENAPEGTNIANALAGKSNVGHTHDITTKNAAPHTHTHNVTVSGTTGTNSGTAVTAVTGYESFSGGTGALTSNTATDGIKYVEAISSTAASLTGTKTFNTDAIKDVTLTASSVSSDGPAYVESVSHTAATLGGTKTFNTDAIKSVSLSASTSSTDGPAYVEAISGGSGSLTTDTTSADGIAYVESISSTEASASGTAKAGSETHTHTYTKTTGVNLGSNTTATDGVKYLEALSGGSGSLKSYDASSGGNAKTSSGRVPYIADVSHTAATLTGTTTFVTGVSGGSGSLTTDANSTNGIAYVSAQGTFSAGTTPVSSAAPTHTSIASGSSSGTTDTIASYSAGVLTINTTVNSGAHTHTYDKTTGITLTRGTAPSLGAATTKYLHHSHTAASASGTGTVGINGGSISKTTYYLDHTHTGASGTTKYFHPVITTESVSSGAPSATATFVTGVTGGTASATTKYLHHTHTAPGATTKYMKAAGTAASKGTVTISGGSITPVTKYMKSTTTAASTGTVGISGGSTNATTKYLHHTHTAATLGSPSIASVASSGHTHSYGSSTALTTGNNSGTAVAAVTAISASTN